MTKIKLRIGLLIDSYNIPSWQYKILKEIQNSRFAEIILVIKNNEPKINSTTILSGITNNKGKIISEIHLKLDEFILGRNTDYSKLISSKLLLKDVNQILLVLNHDGSKNSISEVDLINIQNCNLDIILKFGFKQLTRDILTTAKYGMWSLESENAFKNGEPLAFSEVINKSSTTGFVLKILNEHPDACRIIHRSRILTNQISISKNRNLCYWRTATVIPRIMEGLYTQGESYLLKLESKYKNEVNFQREKFYPTPLRFPALKNIFKHFKNVNKRLIEKMFFVDHWDVLFKINSRDAFLSPLREFILLPTPSDRFWADPFVISKDDKHFIFVEELIYKTSKGHIAVIEIDNKGNFIRSKTVLEKTYHLSYPFLLKYDETYYMIPETGENKTIELYKCIEFPYKWEFVMNLMEDIRTADATLFYHNNKWWLFCCVDDSGLHEGLLDELHLFYSDNLFTKNWKSHPGNPINTDASTARPAGEIFIRDSKIYRPSQDCSGLYGRCININQIIKLTETEYEEKVEVKLLPDWDKDLKGTHTFNSNDKITVIDAFKYKRRIDTN